MLVYLLLYDECVTEPSTATDEYQRSTKAYTKETKNN